MACNKYQNGLIYTIKTDNGLYVGSTIDFTVRKRAHKSKCFNENCKEYNKKLYQNIRENGGEYTIEIYKMFPCNSDKDLRSEEENVRKYLNANLNTNLAFQSVEEKKEYIKNWTINNKEHIKQVKTEWRKNNLEKNSLASKKWIENNKEKQKEMDKICDKRKAKIITCECGIEITKGCLLRHRKSQKHLNLMELKTNLTAS